MKYIILSLLFLSSCKSKDKIHHYIAIDRGNVMIGLSDYSKYTLGDSASVTKTGHKAFIIAETYSESVIDTILKFRHESMARFGLDIISVWDKPEEISIGDSPKTGYMILDTVPFKALKKWNPKNKPIYFPKMGDLPDTNPMQMRGTHTLIGSIEGTLLLQIDDSGRVVFPENTSFKKIIDSLGQFPDTSKHPILFRDRYGNVTKIISVDSLPTPTYVRTHYKSSSGGGCSQNTYIMYLVGGNDLSVYLFFTNDISEVVKSFSPVATKMKYYPKDKCLWLQIYSDLSTRQLQGFVTDVICSSPSPRPIPDTTIKPSYSYFLRHDNPQRYYQALDSVYIISGLIGKAMLYEDAVYWLNARARNLGILYNESRVDSVKVGGVK